MVRGEPKTQTVLRLNDEMREWLCEEAKTNGRTINGEVVYRLRKMKEQESGRRQA